MKRLRYVFVAALIAQPLLAAAQSEPYDTPQDFEAWLQRNQAAEPQFVDGDLIEYGKADLIRPFVPPSYQDEMIFEGMKVQIKDAGDITPADVYKKATAEHQSKTSIGEGNTLLGYVAGMPFDKTKLTIGSAEDGTKMAWDFNFRWQNDGLQINDVHWVWVRRGGSHENHEIMNDKFSKYYLGGGSFERVLAGPYQRVYFSYRSDLADQGYTVAGSWAQGTEFREYTGFTSPFDIAGTAFLILRHTKQDKADDSWAYIPSLRRVRRISVEVKSDSLLGTDHTLEDFYCFAGRVPEWDWEYKGTARILAVARSRNTDTIYYGPNGWVPLDDWALRRVDVVRAIPKRQNHPYQMKHLMIDRDSGECYFANAYDRGGKFWKLWQLSKNWTDDPWYSKREPGNPFKAQETAPGTRMSNFQSINVIDKQNNRGTLVPCRGNAYPDTTLKSVKRILDVNYLTEGR